MSIVERNESYSLVLRECSEQLDRVGAVGLGEDDPVTLDGDSCLIDGPQLSLPKSLPLTLPLFL